MPDDPHIHKIAYPGQAYKNVECTELAEDGDSIKCITQTEFIDCKLPDGALLIPPDPVNNVVGGFMVNRTLTPKETFAANCWFDCHYGTSLSEEQK